VKVQKLNLVLGSLHKIEERGTYMICNVDDWAGTMLLSLNVVTIAMIIYLDIDVECLGKCPNFHVVSVCSAMRHAFEMFLPSLVNLFFGRCFVFEGCRICADVLSLGVSTLSAANLDIDEWLELIRVLSHVRNGRCSDVSSMALITTELVRE
jgi:hypothetical protein